MIIWDSLENGDNNYIYDLHDLAFDYPKLFRHIAEAAVNRQSGFGYDYEGILGREQEIVEISAMQWEITASMLPQTKADLFDQEVIRIKNEFIWANVQPDDRADVVFWQNVFDPFISFVRRTGRTAMMMILDIPSEELKSAGFSPDLISRVIAALNEWAERQLNPDIPAFEKERDEAAHEDERTDMSGDILSFFFSGGSDEDE